MRHDVSGCIAFPFAVGLGVLALYVIERLARILGPWAAFGITALAIVAIVATSAIAEGKRARKGGLRRGYDNRMRRGR